MKKHTAVLLILVIIAAAGALALSACTTATVTLDLNGGTIDGSEDSVVVQVSGELDLSSVLPQKQDAAISGWTDEEGNIYGAYSVIVPADGLKLTAVYEGVLKFTRVEDGYSVSATQGYKGVNVVIPEKYNDLPVTEVAEGAFANCTSMLTLRIPDSVVRIGRGALSGCTSLKSIVLPFVGASPSTMQGQNNLGMAYMFGAAGGSSWARDLSVEQISVTDIATSLPNGAFEGMTALKYVTLGENITSVGARAFANCTNLVSVTLPEGCTSIGERAFAECRRAAITVKGAVTSLGASAFYMSGLTSITLGEGITSVPTNCFEGSSLTSITLPASVTSVNSSAFRNCTRLTSVTVNSSVQVYSSAFSGCASLTNEGLVFNGGGAFTFAEGAQDTAFAGTKVDVSLL